MATKIRLALTISGAVSLGAYEGGVLAALLTSIRPLCQGPDPIVRLDAIGGASAGSITGLIAARCLAEGMDPIQAMEQVWVKKDSLASMLIGLQDSPLSVKSLKELATNLLDPAKAKPAQGYQSVPIKLTMVLAALRGFDYRLNSGVDAQSYIDLLSRDVVHGQPLSDFLAPENASLVDAAIASGANAVGFPPKLLDRTADTDGYTARKISNLPPHAPLYYWYTDGGTIDNEPLGHTLDLVNELDQGAGEEVRRLHVLIHPHPTASAQGKAWADPDLQPTWVETLLRAENIQRTHTLYEDLRQVEKTNSRIKWADQLVGDVGPILERLPQGERDVLLKALQSVLGEINDDRATFATHGTGPSSSRTSPQADSPAATLEEVVHQIAGIAGKSAVDVEVISPLVLPESKNHSVEEMLAGDIFGHFGGFFDEGMRRSDFDLGYRSTQQWLSDGEYGHDALALHGLDPALARQAQATAQDAYMPSPDSWKKWGKTTILGASGHHPLAAAGLAGQFGRVLAQDAITNLWRRLG
jgi:predicted acylesterase/phospholipase RssA